MNVHVKENKQKQYVRLDKMQEINKKKAYTVVILVLLYPYAFLNLLEALERGKDTVSLKNYATYCVKFSD